MIVRPERPEDRPASMEVERSAFGQVLEANIVEAVRDEPDSFALVAEDGGVVIGHVQMSRAWVGADQVLALGPIAVAPDRQGAGTGAALVAAALEEARRRSTISRWRCSTPTARRAWPARSAGTRPSVEAPQGWG
jgi:putative acetyltransferase